jgi:hypothetical protein
MIAPRSVQGVQGCAGLCFSTQHTASPRITCAVGVCVGCAGLSCAQAYGHAIFFKSVHAHEKKDHANPEKAYTPYTPCTKQYKELIYIGFICVGFVLGCLFSVLGSVFRGEGR